MKTEKELSYRLATLEGELQAVATENDKDRQAFNQRVAERQKIVDTLQGRIAEVKETLSPQSPAAQEET